MWEVTLLDQNGVQERVISGLDAWEAWEAMLELLELVRRSCQTRAAIVVQCSDVAVGW
jgi:hypothetical protein